MCMCFRMAREGRAYGESLWERIRPIEQNICCPGNEKMSICLVVTPVTHCVLFDESHNFSVMQGSLFI